MRFSLFLCHWLCCCWLSCWCCSLSGSTGWCAGRTTLTAFFRSRSFSIFILWCFNCRLSFFYHFLFFLRLSNLFPFLVVHFEVWIAPSKSYCTHLHLTFVARCFFRDNRCDLIFTAPNAAISRREGKTWVLGGNVCDSPLDNIKDGDTSRYWKSLVHAQTKMHSSICSLRRPPFLVVKSEDGNLCIADGCNSLKRTRNKLHLLIWKIYRLPLDTLLARDVRLNIEFFNDWLFINQRWHSASVHVHIFIVL